MEFEFLSLILNAYNLDSPKMFLLRDLVLFKSIYSSVKTKGIETAY